MAQLMNLLGSREGRGVAEGPREEEAEMAFDLLNRPIDPPEALQLVPLKSLRDEATAKRGVEVHAGIAEGMDPDGQLRVLGETPLCPAARLFQRLAANHAHRPHGDGGIPFIEANHRGLEEAPVLPVTHPLVEAILPLSVVVGSLHESYLWVIKIADQPLQEVPARPGSRYQRPPPAQRRERSAEGRSSAPRPWPPARGRRGRSGSAHPAAGSGSRRAATGRGPWCCCR